ncbi:TadA family conjugal transfer-associated ATPase [Okibacterium sp. HSC-33S16]|uniref:TadA family conjugal transfer-associated ATPase n=1 Tax=Okibacterium sp. HSC-33S16 TaxID=2910965 RepID=UPI0027E380CA|nr:TadA family conjugal transfer-associated ATPase [Okibacterium sp. HSC-33S16]
MVSVVRSAVSASSAAPAEPRSPARFVAVRAPVDDPEKPADPDQSTGSPPQTPAGPPDVSPDVGGPAGPSAPATRARLSLAAECGPLGPYLVSSDVTDLFFNGEQGGFWVDRGDGLLRDDSLALSEKDIRTLAVRLIALGGRHIDEATPCVDVRLQGGVRVHAVLSPISVTGTLLSIRVPQVRRLSLAELGDAGMFDAQHASVLARAVTDRTNLLITGAAGSGKTTLLGALLATAPATERIVAIEDVAELGVDHPHFISLESRQANLEGAGAIGMDRLVREALRMRPDRLVVGECRGAEVRELLAALNTGHDGGAGTLHANSLVDVPARVEALGALAGMTPDAVARQTVSAIGLVLHLERVGGVRRLARLGRFELDGQGRLAIAEVAA